MSSASQKLSFTVRRPSPVSRGISSGPESDSGPTFKTPALPRHLTNDSTSTGSPLARSTTSSPRPPARHEPDSSDEDDETQDELVTGFDRFGVQRANGVKKVKEDPLVIPPLQNKDWRAVARRRRGQYVPESAKVQTGADGSVGGLGTKETINTGPVLVGLQVKKREQFEAQIDDEDVTMAEEVQEETVVEETDEQKALRALIAEANGETQDELDIPAIPMPVSEADALKQDVEELPDVASLDDYERVPVSQFGAAMLRGMGWKEGTAASRKRKGMVEPYMPTARPALLGIGAKEQEVYDDGSKSKFKNKRPERKYMPLVKQERSSSDRDSRRRSTSPKRSSTSRPERSPDRRERSKYDRDSDSRRDRDRYDDKYSKGSRDHDRERDSRDYHRSDSGRERYSDRTKD
ncbi:hypothetical protein FA15DRAFT_620507, partial [Coprinopsis marcescibilis]